MKNEESTAEHLARVLADLQAKIERFQAIPEKLRTQVAPLEQQCQQKLKREKFAPFIRAEALREKAAKLQNEIVSDVRDLEKQRDMLQVKLATEYRAASKVVPEVTDAPPPEPPLAEVAAELPQDLPDEESAMADVSDVDF